MFTIQSSPSIFSELFAPVLFLLTAIFKQQKNLMHVIFLSYLVFILARIMKTIKIQVQPNRYCDALSP